MATEFFNKDGVKISAQVWANLHKQGHAGVREFENDRLRLKVIWDGRVLNSENYMPNFRPIFRMFCQNRVVDYEGEVTDRWANDPIEHGTTYSSEREAILAYETFLENWTASQYEIDRKTGNKVFVEAGNVLAPPPPPDPDAPSITDLGATDCDEVGAW